MTATTTVYTDTAQHGKHKTLTVPAGQREAFFRWSDLAPIGLVNAISSVELADGGGEELSLYLFDGSSTVASADYRKSIPLMILNYFAKIPTRLDFHGDFLRLTIPQNSSTTFSVNDLRTLSFNDRTNSLMLIKRWQKNEFTVSATNTLTWPWNMAVDYPLRELVLSLMGGTLNLRRLSDPVFTWLAFPCLSTKHNVSNGNSYMVVSQQFEFHVAGIGLNIWLIFYVHFSIQNKHLKIEVVDMDRFVWPGTGQAQAEQAIDQNKTAIMSALQMATTLTTKFLPSTCEGVYLLPGTQSGIKANRQESSLGDALTDVTIVLENPSSKLPDLFDLLKQAGVHW